MNAKDDEEFDLHEDVGPWTVSDDGRNIYSDDFHFDVHLSVHGDFATDADRVAYSKRLVERLNRGALE